MEPKDEPKKESENKISAEKEAPKKESLDGFCNNDSKNNNAKKNTQFNKLEFDKQHFQIIQQKNPEEISNSKEIEKEHRALSGKNIMNFNNCCFETFSIKTLSIGENKYNIIYALTNQ